MLDDLRRTLGDVGRDGCDVPSLGVRRQSIDPVGLPHPLQVLARAGHKGYSSSGPCSREKGCETLESRITGRQVPHLRRGGRRHDQASSRWGRDAVDRDRNWSLSGTIAQEHCHPTGLGWREAAAKVGLPERVDYFNPQIVGDYQIETRSLSDGRYSALSARRRSARLAFQVSFSSSVKV